MAGSVAVLTVLVLLEVLEVLELASEMSNLDISLTVSVSSGRRISEDTNDTFLNRGSSDIALFNTYFHIAALPIVFIHLS